MKQSVMLTITSLLTLLFLTFHHADDVVRGFAPGKFSNLIPIVFMVIWLYGSKLVLDERRSGYILILVLSLLASGVPVVHMQGAGIAGGRIAHSHAAFFFVWTLIIIGATSLFSVVLAARELWAMRRKA
ncbi:MAG TPA: hypothetical protein VGP98_01220 [Pyrinomonadaceae bacterium]|jgi:hypothetical protein|nr:hypothetical protein [Pyrinomonadaceae bacterium]